MGGSARMLPLGYFSTGIMWLFRIFIVKRVIETAYDIRLFAIKSYGLVIHEFGQYFCPVLCCRVCSCAMEEAISSGRNSSDIILCACKCEKIRLYFPFAIESSLPSSARSATTAPYPATNHTKFFHPYLAISPQIHGSTSVRPNILRTMG